GRRRSPWPERRARGSRARRPGSRARRLREPRLVRGPRDVRLVERHLHGLEAFRALAEIAARDPRRDALMDRLREELRRRVLAGERGLVVEIAVVQLREHRTQRFARGADVDDDAVRVERGAPELDVDDVRRAVQTLRGTERLAGEAVRDQEVVADG